jgi:hypothetical protein
MKPAFLALCSTLLFSSPGTASISDVESVFPQQINARQLMTFCASSNLTTRGRTQRRYCDGFVSGVEEGLRLYEFMFPVAPPVSVCVPVGTSSRELSQAFVQYATSVDVDLEKPAAAVVLEALKKNFAC